MANEDDAVIWLRPEVTGRGRTPGYSRAQIAKAAIAVADAEGLEAASMRRVAAEIGAAPMSLYRYVRNKGELHVLMADEALGAYARGWQATPEEDWTERLRRTARTTRRLILDHPWWAELVTRQTMFGPTIVRMYEKTLEGLDDLGLDIDEMMEIAEIVQTFVVGFAQREFHSSRAMATAEVTDPVQVHSAWHDYVKSLIDSGEYPYLRRIVVEARVPHESDPQVLFERALGRIIAGIAATVPAISRGRSGAAADGSPPPGS